MGWTIYLSNPKKKIKKKARQDNFFEVWNTQATRVFNLKNLLIIDFVKSSNFQWLLNLISGDKMKTSGSVTRFGFLWKSYKINPNIWRLSDQFWKLTLLGNFWGEILGYFCSKIWSHWSTVTSKIFNQILFNDFI